MESKEVKTAVVRQILAESQMANVRHLIERLNGHCFEKCIPQPGTSISTGEKTCIAQCTEKYLSAWNQVEQAYMRKAQQNMESGHLS